MLDWYTAVFELIDMRSFSNLWYWIALVVVWMSASRWVLGVPYDMVLKARRHGGHAQEDLHDIVRVHVNRLLYIAQTSGLWMLAVGSFLHTVLAILAFIYGIELAQALFLIAFPLSLVFLLSVHTAKGILEADGADLYLRLTRHRVITQGIGMTSVFVTALWGMLHTIQVGPL